MPLRAVSSVFSLYSLARLEASHRLIPQSTYSLTWWVARRVSFWDVDVVPEDSHMFFKVWLHFGKRVRTRAIYLPVYADAAEGDLVRPRVIADIAGVARPVGEVGKASISRA